MAVTIWRGRLAFSLLSIPARLFKGAREDRVQFCNVYRIGDSPTAEESTPSAPANDGTGTPSNVREFPSGVIDGLVPPGHVARAHYAWVGEDRITLIPKGEVHKAYECEADRYVLLTPSDFETLNAPDSGDLDIKKCVRASDIDWNYFYASYYVAPDHGGHKGYALFYRVLVETCCVALGELVLRGREYPVVIRPGTSGLVLHTLYFGDEARIEAQVPADLSLVDERELELAKMLVNAHLGTFDPAQLKDKYKARVLELVENRASTAVPGGAPSQQRRPAPVVDILDALEKSLKVAPKPPKSEAAERRARKKQKGRTK